ncbi:S-adenosyl-L-methionine-dependent methyltransferase [Lizonia empirigonia]|nr:S-adenosyl-L-methionine-dependent methyltransferase [Lizonia empirigonia]
MKSRLKASYDAVAHACAENFTEADNPTRLNYVDFLIFQLKANGQKEATFLELGCGAGVPATRHLLQLSLARENLAEYKDRLTLVDGDMMALSFPGQTFDAVTGFYSIIHLPRIEQTQLISKIATWLKPNGLLLAKFAVEESEGNVEERWLDHDKGWMYWSAWGEKGSVKKLEDAGFEILVRETKQNEEDANFVWLLAKKYAE